MQEPNGKFFIFVAICFAFFAGFANISEAYALSAINEEKITSSQTTFINNWAKNYSRSLKVPLTFKPVRFSTDGKDFIAVFSVTKNIDCKASVDLFSMETMQVMQHFETESDFNCLDDSGIAKNALNQSSKINVKIVGLRDNQALFSVSYRQDSQFLYIFDNLKLILVGPDGVGGSKHVFEDSSIVSAPANGSLIQVEEQSLSELGKPDPVGEVNKIIYQPLDDITKPWKVVNHKVFDYLDSLDSSNASPVVGDNPNLHYSESFSFEKSGKMVLRYAVDVDKSPRSFIVQYHGVQLLNYKLGDPAHGYTEFLADGKGDISVEKVGLDGSKGSFIIEQVDGQ